MISAINKYEKMIDEFLMVNSGYRVGIRYDFVLKTLTFEMWYDGRCFKRMIDKNELSYLDLEGEMFFISNFLQEGKEAFKNE